MAPPPFSRVFVFWFDGEEEKKDVRKKIVNTTEIAIRSAAHPSQSPIGPAQGSRDK